MNPSVLDNYNEFVQTIEANLSGEDRKEALAALKEAAGYENALAAAYGTLARIMCPFKTGDMVLDNKTGETYEVSEVQLGMPARGGYRCTLDPMDERHFRIIDGRNVVGFSTCE